MSTNSGTSWAGNLIYHVVRPVVYLGQNRLSQMGVALTTTSAFTLLSLYFAEFVGVKEGPYIGIIAFFLLPVLFALGLLTIAAGIFVRYRQQVRSGELPDKYWNILTVG